MYEYIKGIFIGINKDYVIIENNDIGYKVFTSGYTISNMPKTDEKVKLYTIQIVRQDFIGLYGFTSKEELELFNLLLSINGIGAKAALSLLSIASVESLKYAIAMGDEKTIMKASGIGKKTAGRIILELKDKINLQEIDFSDIENDSKLDNSINIYEAVEALVSLGYSENEANKVIQKVDTNESVENMIKSCLKLLMK